MRVTKECVFRRTSRGRVLFLSVAFALTMGNVSLAYAQQSSTTEDDESTTKAPTTMEELNGLVINKSNYKEHISVGNGGSGSTADGTANQRVFVLYNMGAKKFLAPGSFWGRHAALSDKPHLFWLQRRNEIFSSHENEPMRYPSCEEENIDYSLTATITDFGTKFVKGDMSKVYVGSREGYGRSYATYKKLQIVAKNGTVKRDFLKETLKTYTPPTKEQAIDDSKFVDKVLSAPYSPNGEAFYSEVSLSALNFDEGDQLVMELTLPTEKSSNNVNAKNEFKADNILSIGAAIKDWDVAAPGNIHMYYDTSKSSSIVEVDFICGNGEKGKSKSTKAYALGSDVTITLNSDGLWVGDELVQKTYNSDVAKFAYNFPATTDEGYEEYMAQKAGEIIKFKYDETTQSYVKDTDGTLQIDESGNGKAYLYTHDSYVYADETVGGDNASLFISQKIIKTDTSHENVDKYLAYAYDSNLTIEGAVGIYTDRAIDSNNNGKYPKTRAQWTFVPTAEAGVYKLSLQGMSGTDLDSKKTYYLAASQSYVHGQNVQDGSSTIDSKKYYYHQVSEDGKTWSTISDNESGAYIIADLSDTSDDDYTSWKLITLAEYSKLLGNTQDDLEEPADVTYLISDPTFSRNSGGLSAWKMSDGLTSSDNGYWKAKVRIGVDGWHKTTPADGDYYSGQAYNYVTSDVTDYGIQNFFMSTHAQYMCTTIQNGGSGKFYQTVPVYKKGWYILSCQGMSTVGAKLYINNNGDENSYPLTAITQSEYLNSIVCQNASTTYWPFSQNMPMYNAAVWMNDPDVQEGQVNLDKYKTQVMIYVDMLDKHTGLTEDYRNLEIGIEVPESASTSSSVDFTAFDSFQLYFSGDDQTDEKALILNEEFTDMDYLDNTTSIYNNVNLHLWRTFNAGYWNTLVLPVKLTKEQFTTAFGTDAKLVKISKIMENKLVFKSEQETDGIYLQAYQPYLIWTNKPHGDQPKAYGVLLEQKATTVEVSVPKNHFLIPNVTLDPNNDALNGYDFAHKYAENGKYTVVDKNLAQDGDDVNRYATFYGTLCQTYKGNAVLDGRPTLSDGKSYYMGAGSNFYLRKKGKPFGQKGFRCWVGYTDTTNDNASGAQTYLLEINGVTDDVTSIDAVSGEIESNGADAAVYTLSGQKVAYASNMKQLPAGIYIVRGKKMVISK